MDLKQFFVFMYPRYLININIFGGGVTGLFLYRLALSPD